MTPAKTEPIKMEMHGSSKPLVSVIIPTFNHAAFIGDAIKSVIAQTYNNWEIIITNNYSTDDTIKVLKKFKNRRIKLLNMRNKGIIAASRNEAIKHARGEYLAFLDSDDIWKPNKLKMQIEMFNKNPELLAVSTNIESFPDGRRNAYRMKRDIKASFCRFVRREFSICTSSVLMKKLVVKEVGVFDEDPGLIAVEDHDYWLRILRHRDESVLILKNSLVKYRVHRDARSKIELHEDFGMKEYEKLLLIYKKHEYYDHQNLSKIKRIIEFRIKKAKMEIDIIGRRESLPYILMNYEGRILDKLKILAKYSLGYYSAELPDSI